MTRSEEKENSGLEHANYYIIKLAKYKKSLAYRNSLRFLKIESHTEVVLVQLVVSFCILNVIYKSYLLTLLKYLFQFCQIYCFAKIISVKLRFKEHF